MTDWLDGCWTNDDWHERGSAHDYWNNQHAGHRAHLEDLLMSGADEIDGGAGDDLVFGDSYALLTTAIVQGEGVDSCAYDLARLDVNRGLDQLASVKDPIDLWIDFDYKDQHRSFFDSAWNHHRHQVQNHVQNMDNISGNDGNDILFGEDGEDVVSGGIGDDWLIGGADKDVLSGDAGDDTVRNGEDSSSQLQAAVAARQIDWEDSFSGFGQPFVPFGVNGTKLKSTGYLSDYLVVTEQSEETL